MATRDPVVDEVRAIRDAYTRRFGYDIEAIGRDLKAKETASGATLVSRAPRRPKTATR